jgi:predicted dithiol-disulfide oxidoreductase (DUF899 family)
MAKQDGPAIPAPSMEQSSGEFEIVPAEQWAAAREELLEREKALMKERDRLAAQRRRLPVTEVRSDYPFIGPDGPLDLLALFQGRTQLITHRFFFAPDVVNWPDGACTGCSLFADTICHPAHLAARDTTLALVTAAPQDRVEALKKRMGWGQLAFFTLGDDAFSHDFGVEKMFGINVFIRQGDRIFRSYFMNGRGVEEIGPVWSFLDITPLGRQEEWQDVPAGRPQGKRYDWWRLHDSYGGIAALHPAEASA